MNGFQREQMRMLQAKSALNKMKQHERQKFEMSGMKPIISRLAEEQLLKEKKNIETQIATKVIAVTLKVLFDEYDWKAEQLVKVMNEVFEQFELVNEKYVKIEDFYKLLGEMGIKVT